MLIGEYSSNLTSGRRVAIPKKFRRELGGDFLILTRGYEGCLVLVSSEQFENLTAGVARRPFTSGDVRQTTRFLLGGAHQITPDSQGRVVIPENLLEHGRIEEEIIFLGLGKWVEVWDKARWQKHRKSLDANAGVIGDRLAELQSSEH